MPQSCSGLRGNLTLHVRRFVIAAAVAALWTVTDRPDVAAPARLCFAQEFLGPTEIVPSPDGGTLYVLCRDAAKIAVVDRAKGEAVRWIPVPADPSGLIISRDGSKLYVTAGITDGAAVILDAASGNETARIALGHFPCGPSLSPDETKLYVCNRFLNRVAVADLASGKITGTVAVIREPIATAVTPDGKTVFVANYLPLDRADEFDVAAEISWFDVETLEGGRIRLPNGTTDLHDLKITPDGKHLAAVHILARYQMPTTQLERGWMNTNALSIVDVEHRAWVNTVLLDDIDLGAALPWRVVCPGDGRVYVSHASSDEVTMVEWQPLLDKLAALPKEPPAGVSYDGSQTSLTAADVPNDLSFLVGIKQRFPIYGTGPYDYLERPIDEVPKGPRGLCVVDGKIYTAVYFGNMLAVIDPAASKYRRTGYLHLGPKPELTLERRGEMFFYDAALCFQHWQSCASCHPDGRVDGLNWDLLNDGIGTPKNNKSMLLAHQTPPSMWEGVRPDAEAAVRSGIRHIQFAVRPDEDAAAIDAYLKSLRPIPSPYLVNGRLSEAAERGRELFFSSRLNCAHCHPEPLYTDLRKHDVNSKGKFDRVSEFDTPSLIEVWRTAPYMHDGHYLTLEEVFREGRHGDVAGEVDKLTDGELHDLCEFLRSL